MKSAKVEKQRTCVRCNAGSFAHRASLGLQVSVDGVTRRGHVVEHELRFLFFFRNVTLGIDE